MIMRHTFRRRGFVVGEEEEHDDFREGAEDFLRCWNGCWTSPVPIHHATGDWTKEDAQEMLFASACKLDLFQSSDCHLPSADDWGTCGESCGRTTLGMLCHNVYGQVFPLGCPSWDDIGAMDFNDDDVDDARDIRVKLQKKSWRSRCVLADAQQRRRIMLLCWFGAPIQDLMSELQWLDDGGKGLLDVQIAGSALNPFRKTRRRLCDLLSRGRTGPLQPLFDDVPLEEHPAFAAQARAMGLQFSAETEWRFALYFEYPYAFPYLVHPNATEAEKEVRMKQFWARKTCCHDREFSLKVRENYPTWQSLKDCPHFRRLLHTWVLSFLFTNMWSERQLALFRRNIRGPDVDIERLVSVSLLAQILTEHRRLGRRDPRVQTKQELLDMGVPLQCRRQERGPGQCGIFVKYFRKLDSERKEQNIQLKRPEWEAFRESCRIDFKNMDENDPRMQALLQEVQADYQAQVVEAEAAAGAETAAAAEDVAVPKAQQKHTRTFIDAVGDENSPLTEVSFARIARDFASAPCRRGSDVPGFTSYGDPLRALQRESIFVPDRNAIPKNRTFQYYIPCPLAHPELCATTDAHLVAACVPTAKAMYHAARSFSPGTFFACKFVSTPPPCLAPAQNSLAQHVWFQWVSISYVRGAGPQMLMISKVRRVGRVLELVVEDGAFVNLQASTFLGRQWRRLRGENRMMSADMIAAPVDPDVAHDNAGSVSLLEDCTDILDADWTRNAVQFFPPQSQKARRPSSGFHVSAQALKTLFGKERRQQKAHGSRGVKICHPVVPLGVAVAQPDDEEMPDDVQPDQSELGSPQQSEVSSEGSDEAQDGGHERRHKIDQWLSPGDGIHFARLAKRRGRGANTFEFEGLKFSRLYYTNKWSGAEILSGYSCHCYHEDTERSHVCCLRSHVCVCCLFC